MATVWVTGAAAFVTVAAGVLGAGVVGAGEAGAAGVDAVGAEAVVLLAVAVGALATEVAAGVLEDDAPVEEVAVVAAGATAWVTGSAVFVTGAVAFVTGAVTPDTAWPSPEAALATPPPTISAAASITTKQAKYLAPLLGLINTPTARCITRALPPGKNDQTSSDP